MSTSVARQHLKLLLQRNALVEHEIDRYRQEDDAKRFRSSTKEEKIELVQAAKAKRAVETGPIIPLTATAAARKAAKRKGDNILNPYITAVDDSRGDGRVIQQQIKRAKKIAAGSAGGVAGQLDTSARKRSSTMKNNLSLLLRGGKAREAVSNKVVDVMQADALGRRQKRANDKEKAKARQRNGGKGDDSEEESIEIEDRRSKKRANIFD